MGAFFTLSTSAAVILLVIPGGLCVEIIGGAEVKPHSRPFMALILKEKTEVICGGVLIKPNWVLTAAHCPVNEKRDLQHHIYQQQIMDLQQVNPNNHVVFLLREKSKDEVVLGAHSIKREEEEKQVFKIAKLIRHPCYWPDSWDHDLMLLQLNRRAKFNKAVKPIRLPTSGDDPKPETVCRVAGWGKVTNESKDFSDTLREANVAVIDRETCNCAKYYGNKPTITDRMICAGSEKGESDSCQGDSGGPLICKNVMRGITSFGKKNKCGAIGAPGVYTRLTKQYIQWIRKTIGGDL